MTRTGILVDETDRRLGAVRVPETIIVVQRGDDLFVRTGEGIRLRGGGIGIIFRATEVFVRDRLDPA